MAAAARNSRIRRIALVGVALMAIAWIADAAIDAWFEDNSFLLHIFVPSPHEISIRLLFLAVQVAFTLYILGLFRRQSALEEALAKTSLQAGTERAKAESILEDLGDGISIQDLDLRILYQNRRHRELMGDHRGEFCYRIYQDRNEACPECDLLKTFADGQTHRGEVRHMRHGNRLDTEIVYTPLRDPNGRIVAGIEAVRDITERKRMEGLLHLQRTAMESASDGMAILDSEGCYVYLNRAHAEIYAFSDPSEILGRSWRKLYTPEEAGRFENDILPVLQREGHWRGEATGRRRDGSLFPQEVSLTRLDAGGIICVVQDISQRKESENAIRQINLDLARRAAELATANTELETFSYSLSHDIRSYLTRISLATQTLDTLYAAEAEEKTALCLRTLHQASAGMEALIEAMLTLARVTQRELHREQVDLSQIAREIIVELTSRDPQRQVRVIIAPDLKAEGDSKLLRVALENLLANAWKYTRDCPAPQIEFGRNPDQNPAIFFVRDNGIGFDMAEVDQLFEPFRRLTSARGFPGTGVGLATVQRIIARHGGSLTAEGRAGQGASFTFTLP
jgi:PAS domain S-box-containing protein